MPNPKSSDKDQAPPSAGNGTGALGSVSTTSEPGHRGIGSSSSSGIKEPASTPSSSQTQTQLQQHHSRLAKERLILPVVPSMSSQSRASTTSSSAARPASGRQPTSSGSSQGLHGPSNLPPVPYNSPSSPWKPKTPRKHSRDIEPNKLGTLMNRMDRLEAAVGKYVDERGKEALKKSVVPGMEQAKETKKGN